SKTGSEDTRFMQRPFLPPPHPVAAWALACYRGSVPVGKARDMSDVSHPLDGANAVQARVFRRPAIKANRIYVAIGLLVAAMAVSGFWPTYFGPLVQGVVDKPFVIHVHATVFSGWVLLFIAQAVFAATGQIALHRKLGEIGIYYGFGLIAMGVITAFTIF